MKYLILPFLLINFLTTYGQRDVYDSIDALPISDSLKIIKIDSLIQHNLNANEYLNVDYNGSRYSSWLYFKGRVKDAPSPLLLSIKHHRRDSIKLQKKYFKLGQFYYFNKDYEKSIIAQKNAISKKFDSLTLYRSYTEIGDCYFRLGKYGLSKHYYEVGREGHLKNQNYYNYIGSVISSFNTLSRINTKSSRLENINNLLKADSLSNTIEIRASRKRSLKQAIGAYYTDYETRNIEKGVKYLNEALSISLKLNDSLRISNIYTDLGTIYNETEYEKSVFYYKKALEKSPNDNINYSTIYANLGFCNIKLKKFKLGLEQQYKSLQYLTGYDFKKSIKKKCQSIIEANYKDENLWIIVTNLAGSYLNYYELNKNPKYLEQATYFFKIADQILDLHNRSNKEIKSKLIWRQKAASVYSAALKSCYLSQDMNNAFLFMEKNKALVLYQENANRKLLSSQNSHPSVLKIKKQLDRDIIEEQRKIGNGNITIKLINLEEKRIRLIDSIKHSNSDQADSIVYNPKNITQVQENISPNTAIIEYYISVNNKYGIYPSTNAYGLLITKEKSHLFEIPNQDLLKSKVEQLLALQATPHKTLKTRENYKKIAYGIYGLLFPKEIQKEIVNKKLTIIPDNYLSQIPYESLIVSDSTSTEDYLIYYNQIDYKYSHTFHEQNKENVLSRKPTYAAFAPINFKKLNLSQITNSDLEVNSIDRYLSGESYKNNTATKQEFFDQLSKKGIIHLATHANANDSINPWIAFSDQKVFLDEISLAENNAPLVVLSACNTTTGEIQTGEGVMSLARGFFYGGTQSTVSSLWQIDDRATNIIIEVFYKNLKNGQAKSTALHNAKLTYLNNHSGSETSPYYWASLILIGDSSPLPESTSILYYIFGSLLIIIGIIFIKLQKNNVQQFVKTISRNTTL